MTSDLSSGISGAETHGKRKSSKRSFNKWMSSSDEGENSSDDQNNFPPLPVMKSKFFARLLVHKSVYFILSKLWHLINKFLKISKLNDILYLKKKKCLSTFCLCDNVKVLLINQLSLYILSESFKKLN